jgi:phosphatidylinositol-3-phosphatase
MVVASLLFSALAAGGSNLPPIQTVFLILMENHSWSQIKGSSSAPYINNTLFPMASYCEGYSNVPGLHPSLPNYLWLEAGTNFGILDDNDPAADHQNTTNHLVTLLKNAGVSWKTYQEDISGAYIPLTGTTLYAPRHNPFVYFDDVTNTNNPNGAYGIAHIRPYSELAMDLASNTVAHYNFITPNLCDDMHNTCYPLNDPVLQGDNWLAHEVPMILNSQAYTNGGALFITWDECSTADTRLGMIVLSPLARGHGYTNTIPYTHSSTLRTMEEILNVRPFLGDAANAADLSDLFMPTNMPPAELRISDATMVGAGVCQLTLKGVNTNTPVILLASTDLKTWGAVSTNVSAQATCIITVTNSMGGSWTGAFFRIRQDGG